MYCMIKGSCTGDSKLFGQPSTCSVIPFTQPEVSEHLIQPQFVRVNIKGWTWIVRLTGRKTNRFLANWLVQGIWGTDGFLLHPFHIFISFLELYDTVFHMPERDQGTVLRALTAKRIYVKTAILKGLRTRLLL